MSARVGVREIRQNLSKYLDRVAAGETLEITKRGERVALLGPPPERRSEVDWMVAELGASRPKGGLENLAPPPPLPEGSPTGSELLERMRDAERP